jgi:glycosyltransferase involved in cell wall biosynthesis
MLIDFCLPAKNEELILKDNIERLLIYLNNLPTDYNWRIIILINGSTDKSYQISQELTHKYPQNCQAFNFSSNGKSLTLKEYFKQSPADILAFMDIDLAVNLNDIPSLINPLLNKQADLVIGSRFLPKSKTNRSLLRNLSSYGFNCLSRLIFQNKISDLQCGFKAFKKTLFTEFQAYFQDNRWFFDAELIMLTLKFNYKIQEIPVDWKENRYYKRKSKVRKNEAWYFVKKLFSLKRYLQKL